LRFREDTLPRRPSRSQIARSSRNIFFQESPQTLPGSDLQRRPRTLSYAPGTNRRNGGGHHTVPKRRTHLVASGARQVEPRDQRCPSRSFSCFQLETTAMNVPCLVLHVRRTNFLAAQNLLRKTGDAFVRWTRRPLAQTDVSSLVWAPAFLRPCNPPAPETMLHRADPAEYR
jgi:hypothetical protein